MEKFFSQFFSQKFLQKLSLLLLVVFLGGCETAPVPAAYLQYLLGDKQGVVTVDDISIINGGTPTMRFTVNNSKATSVTVYTFDSTNTLAFTEGAYSSHYEGAYTYAIYEGSNTKLWLANFDLKSGMYKLYSNGVLIDEGNFVWWFGDINLRLSLLSSDNAFIMNDEVLYLFNDDGKILTKRTYNTSDKTYTDTEYTATVSTGTSVTYKLDNEEINITDITASGGKIDGVTFKYFSLGKVNEALESVTASDLYDDYLRYDSEGSAYFLGNVSSVSFDNYFYDTVQTIFDSTGSDTESYIANYVTNIVENYVFDSKNDVRVTMVGGVVDTIEGDNATSVSSTEKYVKVIGSISGTLYIEGDIVNSSSYGIYIISTSSTSSIKIGNIIVNGSVNSIRDGIIIDSYSSSSSSSVGDIIVNGSMKSCGGSSYISYGIRVAATSSSSSAGDIIVNGSVSGSGSGSGNNSYGIYISSSSSYYSASVENIIVNGSVSGSAGAGYGISINYTSSAGDIIVNGGVSGSGSVSSSYGIYIYSSISVGDIIVNGGVSGSGSSSSKGIHISSSPEIGDIILSGGITGGTYGTDNITIYNNVKNIYTYIYYTPDKKDKYDFMVYF